MPAKAESVKFLATPFVGVIVFISVYFAFLVKDEVVVTPSGGIAILVGLITLFHVFSFLSILLQQFLIFFLAVAKKIIRVSPVIIPIRIARLVNVIDVLHVKSYFC